MKSKIKISKNNQKKREIIVGLFILTKWRKRFRIKLRKRIRDIRSGIRSAGREKTW